MNKQDTVNSFCMFLFGFACLSSFFPPLRALVGEYVPTLLCLIISVLYLCIVKGINDIKVSIFNFIPILSLVYIFIITSISGNSVLLNRYFSLALLLCGFPVFRAVLVRSTVRSRRVLLSVLVIFALMACVRTIFALLDDPYVSRSIKSEGAYSINLQLAGIGGYEFVYFSVLSTIVALGCAFETNSKAKFLCIASIIMFSLLIVLSNYMTAIIVLIIGLIVTLLIYFIRVDRLKLIVGVACVLVLLSVIYGNADSILNIVSSVSGDARVSRVLQDSGHLFSNILDEFMLDRFPVMEKSWVAFLQSPVIGKVGVTAALGSNGVIEQAGQHSFLLDTFAYFGIFGGMLILLSIILQIIDLYKQYNRIAVLPITIALFIILIFNNATPSISIVIFVALPLIAELEKLHSVSEVA